MKITPNSIIWRYMDLAKYVCLLSRGLFFTMPSEFNDGWEGSWAKDDVLGFREHNQSLNKEEIIAAWQARYESKRNALNAYGLSCWHLSDKESAALWDLYIPRGLGVAVQSTVQCVLDALAANGRAIESREIKYIEYDNQTLGDHPLTLLSHKRIEFAFEREFRFFVSFRADEIQAVQSMIQIRDHRRSRHVPVGNTRPLVVTLPGFASNDKTIMKRVSSSGIYLDTDTEKLVQSVHLAPQTPLHVRRAVLEVTSAFGLSRKLVVETQLDMSPFDLLEFHDSQLPIPENEM